MAHRSKPNSFSNQVREVGLYVPVGEIINIRRDIDMLEIPLLGPQDIASIYLAQWWAICCSSGLSISG